MRGKRSKQYKKLMQQYGLVFGFREPYQVLVDAQMLQDANRFAMDLVGGLERVLHGKVKPMITQCSMRHLYALSSLPQPQKEDLIIRAKAMERRRCNHHLLEQSLSTLECISSVLDPKGSRTNKHRYVVASQEEEVRRYCRAIRGVPLVYVKRSVMVMEPMADSSLGAREGFEKGKFRLGIRGKGTGVGEKRKRGEDESAEGEGGEADGDSLTGGEGQVDEVPAKKKKIRGLKGPNPLSVKKSRKEREGVKSSSAPGAMDNDAQLRVPDIQRPPSADPTNSIVLMDDEEAGQFVKRKRKRKHKPSKLAKLLEAENTDGGSGR